MTATTPQVHETPYSTLRELFAHANSFEWDEHPYGIDSKVKNPNRLLTPSCFWAMTSAQFFPHVAYWFATDDDANEAMMEDV